MTRAQQDHTRTGRRLGRCGGAPKTRTTAAAEGERRELGGLVLLAAGSLVCLLACAGQPTSALFNCFTPNMFKMGAKFGGQQGAGAHPGERAAWYPQAQQQQQQLQYSTAMAYGQHPMSRLFQPKWRSSLFGPKRWMDWRMGGAGAMNFYRPGQGYWPPTAASPMVPAAPSSYAGQQFSEQLNPYGLQLPPSTSSNSQLQQQQQQQQLANNDGWSVPYISNYNRPANQQQQVPQLPQPYADSYSVLPGGQGLAPAKQQLDPNSYGTKGASGNKQQAQLQASQGQPYGGTTKNSLLVADGGYSALDAHLMDPRHQLPAGRNYSHTGFGYAYPEWYAGVVDSPAKIAQQLHKIQQRRVAMGLKY